MRDLKFRAWNGKAMEYGGFAIHATGKTVVMAIGLTGVTEDSPIMQFSGLKDKNGKEIYEGDCIYDHIGHGVIEYAEKYAAFRVNYRDDRCKWFYDYLDSEQASIEVIGNIHENEELTK